MKISALLLAFVLVTFSLKAQENDLSGSWKGSLDVMGQELPLVFHFEKTEDGYQGTADSPAQGAKGMTLKKILFNGLMAAWEFEQIPALYEGIIVGDTLKGNFTQSGSAFPLDLIRMDESEMMEPERPQEPHPPYNYDEIETTFNSSVEGQQLKGTITKPKGDGPFPAIVLVSGSGPQNRDSETLGHKPFLVIADYLSRNGIIVLRYDERGVGESEGDFTSATSMDFKDDAAKAVSHIRTFPFVDQQQVGLIGHSEGAMIGWMLAAGESDLDFLIALTAPVVPIDELMEQQTLDVLISGGASQESIDQQLTLNKKVYKSVKNTQDYQALSVNLEDMLREHLASVGVDEASLDREASAIMDAFGPALTPWFFEFIRFRSQPYIENISIPVFAVFGGKDLQVKASTNSEALKTFTADHSQLFTIKTYPELNHLMQTAPTGTLAEYASISETFNEEVLSDILEWLKRSK